MRERGALDVAALPPLLAPSRLEQADQRAETGVVSKTDAYGLIARCVRPPAASARQSAACGVVYPQSGVRVGSGYPVGHVVARVIERRRVIRRGNDQTHSRNE